ncbi:MerR family transcriptional regulator [Actinomadura graeca]|uniref:MerR family transcriptional regulator n=1 Tax=Actinomadura graeca TaxID=2750812 RepID=UPI001E42E680|nr:MerR family transcriptional regulator [Actinomadura graeca]
MDGIWTIGELAEHAVAALATTESAQLSGRVRDMPNERLIRWYTTIGLVDPPLGRRGRAALYGPRHLLQLVAVKRRQALGRTIAEIQLELAAATDAMLEEIAALPSGGGTSAPPRPSATPSAPEAQEAVPPSGRHGSQVSARRAPASLPGSDNTSGRSARPPSPPITKKGADEGAHGPSIKSDPSDPPLAETTRTEDRGSSGQTPTSNDDSQHPVFGSRPITGSTSAEPPHPADNETRPDALISRTQSPGSSTAEPGSTHPRAPGATEAATTASAPGDPSPQTTQQARFWRARPDVSYGRAAVSVDYGSTRPGVVQGVRLAPGLTLLLDVPSLSGDDLAAIETAARPLLDELRRRGLVPSAEGPVPLPVDPPRRPQ